MGSQFLMTVQWCTRLDGTKEEDTKKEQKYLFGNWKNRYFTGHEHGKPSKHGYEVGRPLNIEPTKLKRKDW